ncbi:hypothetical protein ES705_46880 [subsurface metagenome]
MNRKILLFLLLLPGFSLIWGQVQLNPTVISSAGGYTETADISLAWTLGELAVSTLSTTDMILTQGFQQPFLLDINAIDDPEFNWSVNAYPNPVSEILNLRFNIDKTMDLQLKLYDITGKKLVIKMLPSRRQRNSRFFWFQGWNLYFENNKRKAKSQENI